MIKTPPIAVIPKKNFREGTSKSFVQRAGAKKFEGFVVKKDGRYFAYQNLCQHLPVTLDLKDNRFFSHDGKALQCHMHGALYHVETGVCFAGPCEGSKLFALDVVEEEDRLVIRIPKNSPQNSDDNSEKS